MERELSCTWGSDPGTWLEGPDVLRVQELLGSLLRDVLVHDGKYGPKTANAAYRCWQAALLLGYGDGEADRLVFTASGLAAVTRMVDVLLDGGDKHRPFV